MGAEEDTMADVVDALTLVQRGQELARSLDEIEAELAVVEDPDRAFELLQRAKSIPLRIRALELALSNKERRERESKVNFT
jgi:hypothetical protein